MNKLNNYDHSMLRYLLKFVCVYLYMYMLSSITFGYDLLNEIFINVKSIFFLINKKHSKYYYPIRAARYVLHRHHDTSSVTNMLQTLG